MLLLLLPVDPDDCRTQQSVDANFVRNSPQTQLAFNVSGICEMCA
jgi:hypothetical protein